MEQGDQRTVDLRSFKEKLRSKLPAGSPVLSDLLQEPDAMPAYRAAVLISHYLSRLERELKEERATPASRPPGVTCSIMAGIKVEGEAKRLTLTQNASLPEA